MSLSQFHYSFNKTSRPRVPCPLPYEIIRLDFTKIKQNKPLFGNF